MYKAHPSTIARIKKCLKKKKVEELKTIMDDRVTTLERKVQELKKEIMYFSGKANENERKVSIYMQKTDELQEARDKLYIGQMCAEIQKMVFWDVLPVYFDQEIYPQPHVKHIDQDIEKLCGSPSEKREANQRCIDLKRRIGWRSNYTDIIESLTDERNKEAYPYPLDDDVLKEIPDRLDGRKRENVKELYGVWKKLKAGAS